MQEVDLFVIGGGINGCAIARDAAGRGLSVVLAEKGDLAQGTSSASTKLFHGGLRYLEYFEFRLVREALEERETLLRAMPHIAWPMRFVLPLYPGMRFETETPAGKLLARLMPWMKGRRPDWMIRLGLFLYDHLGGRKILPGTRSLDLRRDPAGAPLKPDYVKAYEYSDVWVMDSRLVSLTARDAAARGVTILTRTPVTEARPEGGVWIVTAGGKTYRARSLVNAGGPWVDPVRGLIQGASRQGGVRLVRGSHIVTRKLYDHDRCYFFQGADGRIIFAIPYEDDFTLIGTTDADHTGAPDQPVCTEAERDYLLAFANGYFAKTLSAADVVWSYAGVRPLYNDGTKSATAATRDYVLALEGTPQLLNIFGGKITTHRRLAEAAVAKLFPTTKPWTAGVPLPGGNFGHDGVPGLVQALRRAHPTAPAERLVRLYGTEALEVAARGGEDLGAGLKTGEVDWLVEKEFARTAEDILWRRTKLGLTLPPEGVKALETYLARRSA